MDCCIFGSRLQRSFVKALVGAHNKVFNHAKQTKIEEDMGTELERGFRAIFSKKLKQIIITHPFSVFSELLLQF